MRKGINWIIILFVLEISIVSALDIPRIEPYVNDFANLLTPEEENLLNIQADAIEKNTTYEIAIVTVQNTRGEDRIQFANKLGDQNGVGKKGQDNGVVVLWSVEDGGAIATGRYSESILNDAKVVRIGKEARPLFDNGSYYQAFSLILTNINSEIVSSQEGTPSPSGNETGTSGTSGIDNTEMIIIGIIVLVIGAIIFWTMVKPDYDGFDDFSTGAATGAVVGSVLGRGSRSSGGGGGGGFSGGSFGGGSFGGGGGRF